MKWISIGLLASLLTLAVVAPQRTAAQESSGSVRCDATLTSLLLVAISDYDYKSPIALTSFDFGQYTTLVADAADIPVEQLAPRPSPTPHIGDQAATAVSQAGNSVGQTGLTDLGSAISNLSDAAKEAANAGQQAVQSGAAAINAGAQAIGSQGAANGPMLLSGAVPGEDPTCTALRNDLITFMFQQLQNESGS